MSAQSQEVGISTMETIKLNEVRVQQEKDKRRSCIADMRNSLEALKVVLEADLANSEEKHALASAEVKLGGI